MPMINMIKFRYPRGYNGIGQHDLAIKELCWCVVVSCILFPIQGLLDPVEIGCSAYLGTNYPVNAQPQNQWILIKGWKTAGREGSYESGHFGVPPFNEFVIPKQGIYFVAINLGVDIPTDKNTVKAAIAINSKPQELNGLTAVLNGKQEVYVALSGFVRLEQNDDLSLHVTTNATVTLLYNSVFSFQLVASLDTFPGFRAILSRNTELLTNNTKIEWTTSGTKGLFLSQSGFSILGKFTAACDGIYSFATNLLIQNNASESNATAMLVTNLQHKMETIAVSHSSKGPLHYVHLMGSYKLFKGQQIYLRAFSSEANSWILQGSAFSGILSGKEGSFPEAFSLQLSNNLQISASGKHALSGWTSNGSTELFLIPNTAMTHERFTASTEGVYLASVQINLKTKYSESSEQVKICLSVNQGLNNGLYAEKVVTDVAETIVLSGIIYLRKHQALHVLLQKEANVSVIIEANSKFSLYPLKIDWPVVSATLANNVRHSTAGSLRLKPWIVVSRTTVPSWRSMFDSANGYFTAPVDGHYFVSCNLIVHGTTSSVQLLVEINGNVDWERSIQASSDLTTYTSTLNVAGTLWLQRSDVVSMVLISKQNAQLVLSDETGFFVVLLGANKVRNAAIHAVKSDTESIFNSAPVELGGWSFSSLNPTIQSNRNEIFSKETGRFFAPSSGLYLVAVNIIVQDYGNSSMTVNLLKNGVESGKENPIKVKHPALSKPLANAKTTYTITGTTVVKLTNEDYVSVFLSASEKHFTVLSNSTFSIALVCQLTDRFCSGALFMGEGENSGKFGEGFLVLYNYVQQDPAFFEKVEKSLSPPYLMVKIKEPGLYFVGSSLNVGERNQALNVSYKMATFLEDTYGNKDKLKGLLVQKANSGRHSSVTSLTASGVVFLRKNEKISLRISSFANSTYNYKVHESTFAVVRITFPLWFSGLRQVSDEPARSSLTKETKTGQWQILNHWSTKGTSSGYVNGGLFDSKENSITPVTKGNYIATLSLTLKVSTSELFNLCLGTSNCNRCFIEVTEYLRAGISNLFVAGVVELDKQTKPSVCVKTGGSTTFSIFRNNTFRTLQYLQEANRNNSVNIQKEEMISPTAANRIIHNWTATTDGLFFVTVSLVCKNTTLNISGVAVEVEGKSSIGSSRKSPFPGKQASLSFYSIGFFNTHERILTRISTASEQWTIWNTTFSATFISNTTASNTVYYHVRKRNPFLLSLANTWTAISGWTSNELHLQARDIFVAKVRGVYIFTANIIVRATSQINNDRTAEVMVAVDGDVLTQDGAFAVRTLKANTSWTFNLVSTVYMSKWQSLGVMARSSIVEGFQVLQNSTFCVGLIENQELPIESCKDNGPRIVQPPPPLSVLPANVGKTLLLACLASGDGRTTYEWTKNGKVFDSRQNLTLTNVGLADQGFYRCKAKAENISVTSKEGYIKTIETSPQFINGLLYNKTINERSSSEILIEERFSAAGVYGNAVVSLKLVSGDPDGLFAIMPNKSSNHLVLWNIKTLDYESYNKFSLLVRATNQDYKTNTLVTIHIHLIDINDNPPIFNQSSTSISIYENATIGKFVFRAQATDADSSTNAKISYSMPAGEGIFMINSTTGEITLQKQLARNTEEKFYDLFVKASDGKHDKYFLLRVNVLDVNDFHAVFRPQNYSVNVSESLELGTFLLQVSAVDMDSGLNGKIQYTFQNGNENRTFHLNKETGVITLAKALDYETASVYFLTVSAKDEGIPPLESRNLAFVTVRVIDVNDNSPIFDLSSYSKLVAENVTVGTNILTVRATDEDSDKYGFLKYTILGSSVPFRINSSTGEIFSSFELDFEKQTAYNFIVMATDGGNPHRKGFTRVNITLEDVNDNLPIFQPSRYYINIPEDTNVGSIIGKVTVSDNDGTRNNSMILLNGDNRDTFEVLKDGSVVLVKTLDNLKQSHYNLTITATDTGQPSLTSSTPAIVFINVVDVDHHFPQFANSTYVVKIFRTKIKDFVGKAILNVSATDKDIAPDGKIEYFILDQSDNETFTLNPISGEIVLNKMLGESRVFYVCARDTVKPSSYTCSRVEIKIEKEVNPNSTAKSVAMSRGKIASIVIAILVFLLLVIVIVVYLIRRRHSRSKRLINSTKMKYSVTPISGQKPLDPIEMGTTIIAKS